MKKLIITIVFFCMGMMIKAQTNPIDEMFNKYSEKEGFTVVTISGKMFSMFANLDEKENDADNVITKLKSIRILSVEDTLLNINLNFYSELSKKLDMSVYEDLMLVKEGKDITRFLIKQSGSTISELLIVTGGPGGNSIISIKGDLNLKNISELSNSVGIDELKSLDKIDKESPEDPQEQDQKPY